MKVFKQLFFLSLIILIQVVFTPLSAQADGFITFDGHGYGHGVGLSMTSVYFMAQSDPGYNGDGGYRNILTYFYRDVSFGTIDDNSIIHVQRPDGAFQDISMKEYLYRQAEEPDSWPREGLRTLAVAMRTYAWQKIVSGGYIHDGKSYIPNWGQAWNPDINPATKPNVVAAVNDTAGQTLTYNGQPIVAAYSSSAGGYTARFEDVWGSSFSTYPYADRVPAPWDAYGSNANWQKLVSYSSIEAAYPQIGQFVGLQALSRSGYGDWGGRVTRIRIIGTAGSVEDSGWNFSQKSQIGLKSNYFTFNYYFSQTVLFTMLSGSGQSVMSPIWDSGFNNWDWRASTTVTGDFNADGKDDLAVLYGYGGAQSRLWVFLNDGAGGFYDPLIWWDSGLGNWEWSASKMTAADFNRDGRADIAILYGYAATRQTKAWVFISNGSSFNPPQAWWDSGPNNWDWEGSKVAAGDFGTDGVSDLAVLYGYTATRQVKAFVFPSTGNQFTGAQQWWDSGPNNWDWEGSKLTSGDFNGDNRFDLAILYGYFSTRQTMVWVLPANQQGSAFNSPSAWWDSGPNNWDWSGSKFASGNFNSDAFSDAMIFYGYANSQTAAWLLSSNGGAFALSNYWDSGAGNWDWSRSKFVVGNFDGDGRSDIGALYNYGNYPFTTDE